MSYDKYPFIDILTIPTHFFFIYELTMTNHVRNVTDNILVVRGDHAKSRIDYESRFNFVTTVLDKKRILSKCLF